jgi:DNA replication protein DnaC
MNAQLTTRLRHLRLSGMVDALPGRVAQAEAAPLPHLEFLELLVEDELARRADRLFARRLKQAGITVVKALADFDWSFNPKIPKAKIVELASARFIQAQWRAAHWAARRRQVTHRHGHRRRRHSGRPSRARAQHLRPGGRLR